MSTHSVCETRQEEPLDKPVSAINRYKASLREMSFVLFEQLHLETLLNKAPYENWGEDEVRSSIAECYKWVQNVSGPLNAIGDAEGCRVENGRVKTPTGFKEAWKKLYEAGWPSI